MRAFTQAGLPGFGIELVVEQPLAIREIAIINILAIFKTLFPLWNSSGISITPFQTIY
jgi:hypothetical protein